MNKNRILVLTGPTAAGKSALSLAIAERLGAEIIAMDSMTLYRAMDVGTAKPDAAQRARVPHHLIDVLEPWESSSVAWWLEQATACAADIHQRGKRVLFVGGTPLYLKALLHGLFSGPPADAALRQRLEQEAETLGRPALHARLAAHDPATAVRLHPNDLRRVVRALEVLELTGKPISAWQQQWNQEPEDRSEGRGAADVLWLDRPRDELYTRINNRVHEQIAAGLIEEVRALRALPRPISKEAAQGLGYKELFAYLDGQAPLAQTIERLQTRTRNFAKRQITWFRHMPACRPVSEELTFKLWTN